VELVVPPMVEIVAAPDLARPGGLRRALPGGAHAAPGAEDEQGLSRRRPSYCILFF
jgi:hypothetical protein